jgi:two-component system, cell cycle response regulator DivK
MVPVSRDVVVSENVTPSSGGARRTVLVVNDQETVRQAVVRSLQAHGFYARAATSGREALEFARKSRPDVILIDMDPPALEGWESTRRLKADPVTRGILVVAMSENTQTASRNLAMRVGCDAFAAKPVDVEHLVESVERLLPAS